MASVLRPYPVANARARADNLGMHVDDVLTIGEQPAGEVLAAQPSIARTPTSKNGVLGGHHLDRG